MQLQRALWRQTARQGVVATDEERCGRPDSPVRCDTSAAARKGPTEDPKARVPRCFGSSFSELAAYGRDRRIEPRLDDDDPGRTLSEFVSELLEENLAPTRKRVVVAKPHRTGDERAQAPIEANDARLSRRRSDAQDRKNDLRMRSRQCGPIGFGTLDRSLANCFREGPPLNLSMFLVKHV